VPGIWTEGLRESAIGLVLRAFSRSGDIWAAQTDLLCALKQRFDPEGINLVYPQHELTVVSGPLPGPAD
jgi:small conductance mechanosensitive channel